MSEVYIVTNTELGLDCVVGVFRADDVPLEKLRQVFPDRHYVFHTQDVLKDTYEFEG